MPHGPQQNGRIVCAFFPEKCRHSNTPTRRRPVAAPSSPDVTRVTPPSRLAGLAPYPWLTGTPAGVDRGGAGGDPAPSLAADEGDTLCGIRLGFDGVFCVLAVLTVVLVSASCYFEEYMYKRLPGFNYFWTVALAELAVFSVMTVAGAACNGTLGEPRKAPLGLYALQAVIMAVYAAIAKAGNEDAFCPRRAPSRATRWRVALRGRYRTRASPRIRSRSFIASSAAATHRESPETEVNIKR